LIRIKDRRLTDWQHAVYLKEIVMFGPGFGFLVVVVVTFCVFGGVLGWASWEDGCASHRKNRT
jgi:hypothetical protein